MKIIFAVCFILMLGLIGCVNYPVEKCFYPGPADTGEAVYVYFVGLNGFVYTNNIPFGLNQKENNPLVVPPGETLILCEGRDEITSACINKTAEINLMPTANCIIISPEYTQTDCTR